MPFCRLQALSSFQARKFPCSYFAFDLWQDAIFKHFEIVSGWQVQAELSASWVREAADAPPALRNRRIPNKARASAILDLLLERDLFLYLLLPKGLP